MVRVLVFFIAGLCAPTSSGADAPWATPTAGLEHRVVPVSSERGPVDVHVLRFSPDRFELRALPAADLTRGTTAAEAGASAGAVAAVNGGFFLDDGRPLGLLVSEGRELNPLRAVDWGVFWIANRRAGLVHRRDWETPTKLEFAIEAGPRLVVGGRPLHFKPQRAERTALGILPDGRVVVVATRGELLTSELAAFLAAPVDRGGLGCRWALNLDGGSSTQLWLSGVPNQTPIPAITRVANVVAIFPRR